MPTVQLGEQSLYYFEHRVPDSRVPALLLIHGAGGQHAHWPPQVRRLRGVPTYAPDLPGHGRSEGPGRTSIAAFAADMLALADALKVERFIPVGHSMGGAIAQQLALDAPGRVAGLVLVASGARLRVTPRILDNVLSDFNGVVDFVIAHQFGPGAAEDMRRLAGRQLRRVPPEVVQGDYAACHAFDVRDRLAEVAVPVLVVGGTADQMTPPLYAQFLADNLPHATLHLLAEAGHMVPAERPDELAHLMQDWLTTHFES